MTYNPNTKVLRRETLNVNRTLMQRYYLVQKVKEADVIGIVVATLGVGAWLRELLSN
jgi:diphthamide biosynthesis protein 2